MTGTHLPAVIPGVAVIGGGPAGLMAAEHLSKAGCEVHLFDAMPSLGRKFLLAGRGGLNLTHSEPLSAFISRYRMPQAHIERWLAEFDVDELRRWASGLGIETFVGSSGRVFPVGMKTSPLLRAWLARLGERGVNFHLRHRWLGWDAPGALRFAAPQGEAACKTGRKCVGSQPASPCRSANAVASTRFRAPIFA